MSERRTIRELRWWERTVIALFGVFVASSGSSASGPWNVLSIAVGVLIVLAAVGVFEVVMALWYRSRRGSS